MPLNRYPIASHIGKSTERYFLPRSFPEEGFSHCRQSIKCRHRQECQAALSSPTFATFRCQPASKVEGHVVESFIRLDEATKAMKVGQLWPLLIIIEERPDLEILPA